MDMTIATLKRHKVAVLAAVTIPYSNGPIEGINRLIKSFKRSCFGFKNQLNFFDHNHFCNNDNTHNDDNDDYYHHRGNHCDYCGNDYNYRDRHYSGAAEKESDGFAGKSGSGRR